jgi:hypothetical protein
MLDKILFTIISIQSYVSYRLYQENKAFGKLFGGKK